MFHLCVWNRSWVWLNPWGRIFNSFGFSYTVYLLISLCTIGMLDLEAGCGWIHGDGFPKHLDDLMPCASWSHCVPSIWGSSLVLRLLIALFSCFWTRSKWLKSWGRISYTLGFSCGSHCVPSIYKTIMVVQASQQACWDAAASKDGSKHKASSLGRVTREQEAKQKHWMENVIQKQITKQKKSKINAKTKKNQMETQKET